MTLLHDLINTLLVGLLVYGVLYIAARLSRQKKTRI